MNLCAFLETRLKTNFLNNVHKNENIEIKIFKN